MISVRFKLCHRKDDIAKLGKVLRSDLVGFLNKHLSVLEVVHIQGGDEFALLMERGTDIHS
jgi:hypothetical protein